MSIIIENLSKSFGTYKALDEINIEVKSGELIALLGPSGSGKTSLLRIIAGLEQADQGRVLFNQEDLTYKDVKERNVGFVFQHYALFRNMTVSDNVAYGLKVRPRKQRPSKNEIKEKVNELLKMVRLEAFGDRYPSQLSGGQRQRVALARALAVNPSILLLDEPFGALDAKVRKELRRWLRKLHDEFHVTSVFVTHDQEEALDVADRVVIMNEGKVEQIGTPSEVYDHPNSPFVYDFIGSVNRIQGRIHQGKLESGQFTMDIPEFAKSEEQTGVGFVRLHNFILERTPSDSQFMKTTVEYIHAVGPVVRLELKRADINEILEIELTKEKYNSLLLKVGEEVYVKPREIEVFHEEVVEDYVI